jgi:hypothetical protein
LRVIACQSSPLEIRIAERTPPRQAVVRTIQDLAGKIPGAIKRFGVEECGKIEILFGEARKPLPFRRYRLVDVKRVGEEFDRMELVGEEVFRG